MMDFAQRLRPPALSPRMRLVAIAVAAAVVAIASTVSFTLMRNQNVALFSRPLQPDQTAEVEARLIAWNVPYVERESRVYIEAQRRNEIALRLSLQGIPHDHVVTTNETLATVGAMTPQSVLDVQAREGLGGDLALGIRSIAGVRDARVIVAPASQGLFADEPAQVTKASVRVTLDPGASLSPATVGGIKTFVAGGVPGLEPANVAVLDDRGIALGSDGQNDPQHDATALQTSLQSALDATVGAGLTLVRVNVQSDPQAVRRHEIRRAPLGGDAIADHTLHEQYKTANKTYAKTHADLDRGSDTVDSETRIDAGRTKRISIAVFVDQTKAAEIANIRTLVTAAAGLDRGRGDALEIAAMSFPQPAAVPQLSMRRTVLEEILPAAPGLLVTLAIIAGLALFARPITGMIDSWSKRYAALAAQNAAVHLPPGTFTPRELHAMLADEPPHAAAVVLSRLPSAVAAEVLELFGPEQRRSIIDRMSRSASPIVADIGSGVTHGIVEDAPR